MTNPFLPSTPPQQSLSLPTLPTVETTSKTFAPFSPPTKPEPVKEKAKKPKRSLFGGKQSKTPESPAPETPAAAPAVAPVVGVGVSAPRPIDSSKFRMNTETKRQLDREHRADGSAEKRGDTASVYSYFVVIFSVLVVVSTLLYDEVNSFVGWEGKKYLFYLATFGVVVVTIMSSLTSNVVYSYFEEHDLGGRQGYKAMRAGNRVSFFGGSVFIIILYKITEWFMSFSKLDITTMLMSLLP